MILAKSSRSEFGDNSNISSHLMTNVALAEDFSRVCVVMSLKPEIMRFHFNRGCRDEGGKRGSAFSISE